MFRKFTTYEFGESSCPYFKTADAAKEFCHFIERATEDIRAQWHWDSEKHEFYVEVYQRY